MSGISGAKSGADTGFALVAVLAFLLIAAAFSAPFLTGAKTQALVTRNTGQLTRDKILLRGLIEMAGTRFFELYQKRDLDTASSVLCPASGPDRPDIILHFQDHSGLIDLNAASAETLAIGFESLTIERDEAARLAAEAVRFRSVDAVQTPRSQLAPPRGGYKHALFELTAELADLLAGINVSRDAIDAVFTVHSGTGTVDEAAARGPLLARFGALKAGERFFIVSDVRRGSAVTVEAALVFKNGRSASASAVLAPGETSGQAFFLEPLSFERSAKKQRPDDAGSALTCVDFFDPVLLDAIAQVTP